MPLLVDDDDDDDEGDGDDDVVDNDLSGSNRKVRRSAIERKVLLGSTLNASLLEEEEAASPCPPTA